MKIIIIFILIFTIVGIVYAATGYRVNNGATVTVDEHSTCQKVTNSSGVDYFVPTKTSGEWSAFRGDLPGGVSLGGCCDTSIIGNVCPNNTIYAGIFNGIKYITTPGNCTDSITPVCNGLIDTLKIRWGEYGILTGANSLINGQSNTNILSPIASISLNRYASEYCSNMIYGGYSDWFLPSKDELNMLYINRISIGGFINGYWSSSEINSVNSWGHNFNDNNQYSFSKYNSSLIRCVRKY